MSRHVGIRENTLHRVIMMAMSIMLIVQTMSVDDELGWRVIFPLIAIYPGLAALIGGRLRSSGKTSTPAAKRPDLRYGGMATQA